MSSPNRDAPPPYHRRNSNTDLRVPMTDVQRMSMEDEERPLPEGWIRQFDPRSAHHFYVDTKATPPRSIWVHPLEDDQYRKEHGLPPLETDEQPEAGPSTPGPSSAAAAPSGSSYPLDSKKPARPTNEERSHDAPPKSPGATSAQSGAPKERGFFGKLKDKAIGTKEEREAYKKQKEAEEREMQRRHLERRQLLMQIQQQQEEAQRREYERYYRANGPLGQAGYRYGNAYAPPPMPYGRRRGYGYGPSYGPGFGGGGFGAGAGLLGGLAGGLLLGELITDF